MNNSMTITPAMFDVLLAMYRGAKAVQWCSDKVYLKTAHNQWEVPYRASLFLFPSSPWVKRVSYGMLSETFQLSDEGRTIVESRFAEVRQESLL